MKSCYTMLCFFPSHLLEAIWWQHSLWKMKPFLIVMSTPDHLPAISDWVSGHSLFYFRFMLPFLWLQHFALLLTAAHWFMIKDKIFLLVQHIYATQRDPKRRKDTFPLLICQCHCLPTRLYLIYIFLKDSSARQLSLEVLNIDFPK